MQKPFSTQPELFVSTSDLDHPIFHSLDDTQALLDWSEIEKLLSSIYASRTGRPSYPLLTLFRGLLLGIWHRLSDVQLDQCLYRDLLFRKFCCFELGSDVPEASILGRFRSGLVERDTWRQFCVRYERLLSPLEYALQAIRIIPGNHQSIVINVLWQFAGIRGRRLRKRQIVGFRGRLTAKHWIKPAMIMALKS